MDYEIDITAFRQAAKMGIEYKKAMQIDIVNHFVNAVSEMVGRKVTVQQIETAKKQDGFNYEPRISPSKYTRNFRQTHFN